MDAEVFYASRAAGAAGYVSSRWSRNRLRLLQQALETSVSENIVGAHDQGTDSANICATCKRRSCDWR